MKEYTVLYDGWDLAYQPNSNAAIHIMRLISEDLPGRRIILALPDESFHSIPEPLDLEIFSTPNTIAGQLDWEQRRIPLIARRQAVDLVHWFDGGPALFGRSHNVISPTSYTHLFEVNEKILQPTGLLERMRYALSQGGFSRAHALLWPSDLPMPEKKVPTFLLPPVGSVLHSASVSGSEHVMAQIEGHELPESFILYHGPTTRQVLTPVLDAWEWAYGSIGEYDPLLIVGVSTTELPEFGAWLDAQGFGQTVRLAPPQNLQNLLALYNRCSAIFHPIPVTPWGSSLRLGMAYARPIVALETAWSDAILGPAAYLIAEGKDRRATARALGGALVTVIVEESLAGDLSEKGGQRTMSWGEDAFPEALDAAYKKILSG